MKRQFEEVNLLTSFHKFVIGKKEGEKLIALGICSSEIAAKDLTKVFNQDNNGEYFYLPQAKWKKVSRG